jgi:hypothetical protein
MNKPPLRHYLQFSDFSAEEYAYVFERAALIKRKFKSYDKHHTQVDRTQAMTKPKCARARNQISDKAGVNSPFQDQPRPGRADLPGILENRTENALDCHVQISVGKHDQRRLSAQFKRKAGHIRRGVLHDADTGCNRTGECNVVNARMSHQRRADFGSRSGHDVEDAGRKPRLGKNFAQHQCGQRGLVRRLRNNSAACGQSRGEPAHQR